MKKLLIVNLLFLTGCSDENMCHFVKGVTQRNSIQCDSQGFVSKDPLIVCQKTCDGYLNTIIRYGNTTNIYSCSCDNQ